MKPINLVLNSPQSTCFLKSHIKNTDTNIAIDGGANYLKAANLRPSCIIGDLDSIKSESFPNSELIHLPDQSLNDFEKALSFLLEKNYKSFNIFGLFEGRFDHALNNIEIILRFSQKIEINILDPQYSFFPLYPGENIITGKLGSIASLFGFNLKTISSHGLKYPLLDQSFDFGKTSQGLSNEVEDKNINITVSTGLGFILITK